MFVSSSMIFAIGSPVGSASFSSISANNGCSWSNDVAITLFWSNSFRPCATVKGARSGLAFLQLSSICRLHHVRYIAPLEPQEAVNRANYSLALDIPYYPYARLGPSLNGVTRCGQHASK